MQFGKLVTDPNLKNHCVEIDEQDQQGRPAGVWPLRPRSTTLWRAVQRRHKTAHSSSALQVTPTKLWQHRPSNGLPACPLVHFR